MNIKEMLNNIPKTNDLVSAYGSINVDDLQEAMNRLKKVPTYDELLKENNKQKEVLDKIKKYLNKIELGELENGKPYTFKDFLKEEKDAEIEEAKWLLELLEEIE